jgi:hypothetical protein
MGTVLPAAAEVVNDARDDKTSPTSADRVDVRDECERSYDHKIFGGR